VYGTPTAYEGIKLLLKRDTRRGVDCFNSGIDGLYAIFSSFAQVGIKPHRRLEPITSPTI
jgi:hypothetical protein